MFATLASLCAPLANVYYIGGGTLTLVIIIVLVVVLMHQVNGLATHEMVPGRQ